MDLLKRIVFKEIQNFDMYQRQNKEMQNLNMYQRWNNLLYTGKYFHIS